MSKKLNLRTSKKRPQRPRILVVTEGKCSEPNYCEHLNRKLAPNLTLELVPEQGMAISVVKAALDAQKKNRWESRRDSSLKYDAIWCFFDRERCTDNKNFNNTCFKANSKGIYVAASNRCFESWVLLHFHYFENADHCCADVFARVKTEITGYKKNWRNFGILDDRLVTAKKNAKKQREFHANTTISTCPSTSVDKFVQFLEMVDSQQNAEKPKSIQDCLDECNCANTWQP